MATVDYFLSFLEIDWLYDLLATTVIKKLKRDMALYGIEREIANKSTRVISVNNNSEEFAFKFIYSYSRINLKLKCQ